jgi:GcrA cell cycle regulator
MNGRGPCQPEWSEAKADELRTLWAEGHSTAEIGRRIAMSKNAVVGKAHRLALAGRPSPIPREGAAPPPVLASAPRRLVGPTLPPLTAGPIIPQPPEEPSAALPPPLSGPLSGPQAPPAGRQTVAAVPAAQPVVRVLPPPRPPRRAPCCWPIGEPGTRSFRFCDVGAINGKPYCVEHAQLAYAPRSANA